MMKHGVATTRQPVASQLARAIPPLVGMFEMLLLVRLIARLLAARPDNPAIQALYLLTDPLVLPLRALDAGQPRFGSILELSTLALLLLLPILGFSVWRLLMPRKGAAHD